MTEKIGYKLNPNKLKGAPQSILPYVVGAFYYTENFEYFDVIKPYLDIPEPRQSLEEISQEFDEKIDDLLVKTQRKFAVSKESAEYHYNRKFNRIIENFEYARKNGRFPEKYILTYSDKLGVNNFTSSLVIKSGGKEVGFYTFGNGYLKYFMDKKPTMIVRFFMNKLLGFRWVDV
jgi:hypothetical protein